MFCLFDVHNFSMLHYIQLYPWNEVYVHDLCILVGSLDFRCKNVTYYLYGLGEESKAAIKLRALTIFSFQVIK